MADVQLEHGYLRIANALYDAVLNSRLTGVQVRLVLALIRDTYGWRRTHTDLSRRELFRLARVADSSTTRAAMTELVTAGVVIVTISPAGRRAGRMALQKDYDRWQLDRRKPADNARGESRRSTGENRRANPHFSAGQEVRKSFAGETCGSPTDRKDKTSSLQEQDSSCCSTAESSGQREDPASPLVVGAIVSDLSVYQIGIARAANETADATFGSSPKCIRWDDSRTVEAAEAMRAAGVPLDFAQRSIAARVGAATQRPYSARYFTAAVLELWSTHQSGAGDTTLSLGAAPPVGARRTGLRASPGAQQIANILGGAR